MVGIVRDILFTQIAETELRSHIFAEVQAGKGIVGDRYYCEKGTFAEQLKDLPDFEITLIEQEEIDNFNEITRLNYSGAMFRRNIVTEDVQLNELVGKIFSIGEITLKGIKLCEPCAHLSNMIGSEVMEHMVHKAGLRAQILTDGRINVSDIITEQ